MSKLWGGRFEKKTNKLVDQFTKSIHYDVTLAQYDCLGSLCHIDVLKKSGLLNTSEHKKLQAGLKKILADISVGSFKVDLSFEDIHSYIQHLLEKNKKVGEVALKLHTCRSRNDQVAFATKCYCIDAAITIQALLKSNANMLSKLAKEQKKIQMPGYTHLQHAIPVSLKNYLLAYREMLQSDYTRFEKVSDSINLTLGSGALAGTFIPAEKYNCSIVLPISKKRIPISAPTNSIATVSDRDFVIEILCAASITGMHLSRLAEDFILWSSKEFDFIDIDETFCTGSSLMPQKKNPDVLELIRGYCGKLYGNLISVLVVMKALPLSYNRDMQLDKEPLFDSVNIIQDSLSVLVSLLPKIKFKKKSIEKQLDDESLYATDIADFLVKKGVPFKTAHDIVGKLIHKKIKNKKDILDMNDAQMKSIHPLLTHITLKKIIKCPEVSVQAKKSIRK